MVEVLFLIGLIVAVFVGYNIGGSSTGVAFGPAVGSRLISKTGAAGLFTAFALVGGWTIGRNVLTKMSSEIIPATQFTYTASVVILFFAGFSLLITNLYGVPASTSMTAVGAIAGLGLATGTLNEPVMFRIVSAWIVAPLVAFWLGAFIGRYLYPYLSARVSFTRFEAGIVRLDRSGRVPRPRLNEKARLRDVIGAFVVLTVSCYNAFSAGASNAANAIAPLVGNGAITPSNGILLAIGAIGVGGFTIARRTLDTVGDDLTDLPILAAMIVSLIGATIITLLSWLGIPASLAVSMTSCIIGLGWGRASRAVTFWEILGSAFPQRQPQHVPLTVGALTAEGTVPDSETETPLDLTIGELATQEEKPKRPKEESAVHVPRIGEEDPKALAEGPVLFDREATSRVVFLWILAPTVSTVGSYLVFRLIL